MARHLWSRPAFAFGSAYAGAIALGGDLPLGGLELLQGSGG
jgi:hypothetical protein